jgi:hypothetical protein
VPEIVDAGAAMFTEATAPAYLKAAIMGFSGSGKTFTAGLLMRGLWHTLIEKKLVTPDTPIFFIESERGSQFEKARFDRESIKLQVAPVRTFADLMRSLEYISKINGLGIIDSISWYWREFCESYAEKKNRKQGLRFDDWSFLKGSQGWGKFTDLFVNSPAHLCMCGRAGYEYDMFYDEEKDKNEIQKSGIKMRAEGETAYEPDLLILMEKEQEDDRDGEGKPVKKVYHRATIFKDRAGDLEHQYFRNPTYDTFKVHIDRINLGGPHVALRTTNKTQDMIPADRSASFKRNKERVAIVLDEIKALLLKHYPSRSDTDKKMMADLSEKHFSTRAWSKIATFDLDVLENGRNAMWLDLEKVPYAFGSKPEGDGPVPLAAELAAKEQTVTQAVDEMFDGPAATKTEDKPSAAGDDRRECVPTAEKPVIQRQESTTQESPKSDAKAEAKPAAPQPEAKVLIPEKVQDTKETPKAAVPEVNAPDPVPNVSAVPDAAAVPALDDGPTQAEEDAAAIQLLENQIGSAVERPILQEMLVRLQAAGDKKLLPDKEVKRLMRLGSDRMEALDKKSAGSLF